MRNLTKSLLQFSWAMSVFGARQAVNLLSPRQGWDKVTSAMKEVSYTAEKHLGETASGMYRAGDQLQRGMVDAVSDLAVGTWSGPRDAVVKTWQAVDRSWSRDHRGLS